MSLLVLSFVLGGGGGGGGCFGFFCLFGGFLLFFFFVFFWGGRFFLSCLFCLLFGLYDYHTDLYHESFLAGHRDGQTDRWPSCAAKTLTFDIAHNLFNQTFFKAAMLIDTIDFYYFMPLSLGSQS